MSINDADSFESKLKQLVDAALSTGAFDPEEAQAWAYEAVRYAYGLHRVRPTASACHWIVGLDDFEQRLPRH